MVSLRKQFPQDGAEPESASSQQSGRRFKPNAVQITLMVAFPVAAIAGGAFLWSLPSMVLCGGFGLEMEGRSTLGTLGRAQQAHWSETKNFAPSIASLELDIAETTDNYTFAMEGEGDRRFYSADAALLEMKSFVGAVFAVEPFADPTDPSAEMVETVTIVCSEKLDAETDLASVKHLKPSLDGNMPVCHPDTELETRTPYFPLDTDATVSLQ